MFCRLDVSSICIFYKGNETIVHQRATSLDSCRRSSVQSVRGDGTSHSPSPQSNNSSCATHGTTLVTTNALLVSKITSSGEVTSTRQRSKWWTLPWSQSSLAEATKPPKIPLNNKPSNILIQVTCDTVDEISHDPQQTEQHPLKQVSDEEVAFVWQFPNRWIRRIESIVFFPTAKSSGKSRL